MLKCRRCFVGFLLSLVWLGNGAFSALTISKWMIYIWFGLDGSGIHYSVSLAPSYMYPLRETNQTRPSSTRSSGHP